MSVQELARGVGVGVRWRGASGVRGSNEFLFTGSTFGLQLLILFTCKIIHNGILHRPELSKSPIDTPERCMAAF